MSQDWRKKKISIKGREVLRSQRMRGRELLEQLPHLEPLHLVEFISTKYARVRSKCMARVRAVNSPGQQGGEPWKCFLSEAEDAATGM